MRNIFLEISYIGSGFFGFQKQPGKRTVESVLQRAIEDTVKHPVKIFYGGRTDRGVHSQGQAVNFYSDTKIDIGNLPQVINYHLPKDVSVIGSKYVDEKFHARYSAKKKHYRYLIYNGRYRNSLYEDRAWHFPFKLDEKNMQRFFDQLPGERDFASFMGKNAVVKDTIRRLDKIEVRRKNNLIIIDFYGKSFLKNMIRIMVGSVVKLSHEKKDIKEIKEILDKTRRGYAGPTAPAHGLYFLEIEY